MIKKNERAKYDGVLMPELNYRNYKELEEINPKVVEMVKAECVESQNTSVWASPFLWVVIGFAAGFTVTR